MDEYLEDVHKNFPGGLNVQILNSAIDYSRIDSGMISMFYSRVVKGKNISQARFENHDTLQVDISMDANGKYQIERISPVGSHFSCLNDKDDDGVMDNLDACPQKKGSIRFDGCPDTDHDGIPDNKDACWDEFGNEFNKGCPSSTFVNKFGVSLFTSIAMNSLTIPAPETLSYLQLDKDATNMGEIEMKNGMVTSLLSGIEVEMALNQKNNFSLGVGLLMNKFSTAITWTGFKTEYQAQDIAGNQYRQRLTILSAQEDLDISTITIPVLFKYKSKISEKLGFYIEAGPALHLISIDSKATASFTKEAIYVYKNQAWQYTATYSTNEAWLITAEQVTAIHGDPRTYFQSLENQGYDVAYQENSTPKDASFSMLGFGGIVRGGLMYFLDPSISIIGGPYFQYAIAPQTVKDYKPIDRIESKNQYNSVLNGVKNISSQQIGFLIGVKFGF
ncbi:MAG: hypothetical protein IPP51_15255 [Bacteroidetes bacterium]|nr:hypothetical protein [Bacteroidota bacterium]